MTWERAQELLALAIRWLVSPARSFGLTDDEVAFYDALAGNHSAERAVSDGKFKVIIAELLTQLLQHGIAASPTADRNANTTGSSAGTLDQ